MALSLKQSAAVAAPAGRARTVRVSALKYAEELVQTAVSAIPTPPPPSNSLTYCACQWGWLLLLGSPEIRALALRAKAMRVAAASAAPPALPAKRGLVGPPFEPHWGLRVDLDSQGHATGGAREQIGSEGLLGLLLLRLRAQLRAAPPLPAPVWVCYAHNTLHANPSRLPPPTPPPQSHP